MNKQMSLSALNDELAQVRTKKKEFLEQIERIVPWGKWVSIIKPCYYKGERGNKPYDLELMLRLYLLQNLYIEIRISDINGKGIIDRLTIQPGEEINLNQLKRNVKYIVEIKTSADFFLLRFI